MISSTRSLRNNHAVVAVPGNLPVLIVICWEDMTQGKDVTNANSEAHKTYAILASSLLIAYRAAGGQGIARFKLFSQNGQSSI